MTISDQLHILDRIDERCRRILFTINLLGRIANAEAREHALERIQIYTGDIRIQNATLVEDLCQRARDIDRAPGLDTVN